MFPVRLVGPVRQHAPLKVRQGHRLHHAVPQPVLRVQIVTQGGTRETIFVRLITFYLGMYPPLHPRRGQLPVQPRKFGVAGVLVLPMDFLTLPPRLRDHHIQVRQMQDVQKPNR